MRTVKTHCVFCTSGLEIPGHEVLLTVYSSQSWRNTFRFVCPLCREENVKHATSTHVQLLANGGVRMERVHVPDELEEDPHRWDQRAITWDDVLDFAAALAPLEDLARKATT